MFHCARTISRAVLPVAHVTIARRAYKFPPRISDVKKDGRHGDKVEIQGWVRSHRVQRNVGFLDIQTMNPLLSSPLLFSPFFSPPPLLPLSSSSPPCPPHLHELLFDLTDKLMMAHVCPICKLLVVARTLNSM